MSSGHGCFPVDPAIERLPHSRSSIGPYACKIATHYEILGVPADASADRIRAAYRDRARQHHPDRVVVHGRAAGAMTAVNEAYRVVSDPGRRLAYDRSLLHPTTRVSTASAMPVDHDVEFPSPPPPFPSRLMPAGPARVPWKLMLVAAIVGSGVVLVTASFNDPPSTEVPDGILRTGSCVEIEANGDVREIACTGVDDIVVDLVIPTDATCPMGSGAYRDRLGLGTVCIEFD